MTSATKAESRKVRDFKVWISEEIAATMAQFSALDSAAERLTGAIGAWKGQRAPLYV